MAEEDKEERWYFPRDLLLANSPSRRHGYDSDKELSCRQQAANLIQDMGQKLQVSQLCINTAIVYMHRFYVFHSLHAFPRNNIAAATLFLAAKVEEQPRKVEHVLKVAHICLHRDNPSSLDIKSEQYQEQANELTLNESIILQTLGFEVAIDHPHTHVVRCCQLVKASKDLAQTSYFMASNSLHLTTMCLQYKPTVVACFCIHLACKWSNWEIPRSSEGKDWFWYVNQAVSLDLLEQMTSEFLIIFDKCPTKLKKKMMSMNQSNSLNFGVPINTPQENYHFDEPRKLMGAEANRPPEGFAQMQQRQMSGERPGMPSSASQHPPSAPQAQAQPQASLQPVPRHMDYKEYKEYKEKQRERERLERERAEKERMHRDAFTSQPHPNSHSSAGHIQQKTVEKPKQQPSSLQPPQAMPNQQNHRPSNSASAHKMFGQQAQQQRMAPNMQVKDGTQPSRAPGKEALKRKFDEVDNVGEDPNQSKEMEFRHNKMMGHYPPGYTGQTMSGYPVKDNASQHKPLDKSQQNYPFQRPADKYSAVNRQQPPQAPQKMHREETKREELPSLGAEPATEWQQKPGHTQQVGYGFDRYNIQGKAPVPGATQSKPRDPKYNVNAPMPKEGHKQRSMPGALLPPGGTTQPLQVPHKKPYEKLADKQRNKYEHGERGMLPMMGKMMMPDEVKPKPEEVRQKPDPKKLHDLMKKEKPGSKPPQKHKVVINPSQQAGMYHQQQQQQQQQQQYQLPSLFDPPLGEMSLPSLLEPLERPSKMPRLDEKRRYEQHTHVHGGERREDRPVVETFVERKEERKPERKRLETQFTEDRKMMDLFGFGESKPAFSSEPQKPKSFSIFSPENHEQNHHNVNNQDQNHLNVMANFEKEQRSKNESNFGIFAKKPHLSSLFSPPLVQGASNHRGSGSHDLVMPSSEIKLEKGEDAPVSFDPWQPPRPHQEFFGKTEIKTEAYSRQEPPPPPPPQARQTMPQVQPKVEPYPTMSSVIQPAANSAPTNNMHQQRGPNVPSGHGSIPIITYDAPVEKPNNPVPIPPKTSPVSTVNLMNMGDMVDTRTNVAAVMTLPPTRSEVSPAKSPSPEEFNEEKPYPVLEEGEIKHKSQKKKKSKDKDRDREKDKDSHRHKDKKKSDEKKEKKKHRDKERKKDSHRDKERSDRPKHEVDGQHFSEPPLKVTIPMGLKMTFRKNKSYESASKPTPPQPPLEAPQLPLEAPQLPLEAPQLPLEAPQLPLEAPQPPLEGIKITIKKDAIANYKDDRKSSKKKDKDKEPHSAHHKSSKSSKDGSSQKSSKSHSSSKSSSNRVPSK